jgi:O-antigen/teichoic acid export membrane protein
MGERSSAVQVARGASYLLIENLVTTVIQVVAFAFIARLISTSQMGLLAVLSMVLGLAQLIGPLALPSAIGRFLAEEMAQGRRQSAAAVFYQSTRISLILSAVLAAACFLFAPQISGVFSTEPVIFRLVAVDILLTSGLAANLGMALIGAQMMRGYSLVTIAYTTVRQALIVGLLLLFHEFSWLVCAWVISDFLYVLMMAIPIVRAFGRPDFGFDLRRLLSFSLPLMPGNSISFAYGWYDRALLIPYASLAALGIYNATLTAFGVLSAIPSGISTALYPAYAAIRSIKGKTGLEDAIRVASRYVSFITIPTTLGLLATAKPALSLFVGKQYEYGATVLQIITIFFAFTLLGNAFGNILPLLDQTAASSAIAAASVAVSLVTALLLLPSFGINGAAVSRGIGMLINFALTLALARRQIRLSFDLEALWKSSAASISMVIVVWFVQYVSYNRDMLPAYVLLGGLTYLAGLRVLKAIHASDVQLAKQFLGRRYESPINLLSKVLRAEP